MISPKMSLLTVGGAGPGPREGKTVGLRSGVA